MNVTAEIIVAIIEPDTAYQGSRLPPRKKSSMSVCLPASKTPSTLTKTKYPTNTTQSIVVNLPDKLPGSPAAARVKVW